LDWQQGSVASRFYAVLLGAKARGAGVCSVYTINYENTDKVGYATVIGSNVVFVINDSNYTDTTTLKNAMSGAMLVYELETPIETPISETELNAYRHLLTNKGDTTILNSDGADMEITYYVNKPNAQAIGSLHEQINKDYFKLSQAIISRSLLCVGSSSACSALLCVFTAREYVILSLRRVLLSQAEIRMKSGVSAMKILKYSKISSL
jgi:maltodextrin utilization protein YvdJ